MEVIPLIRSSGTGSEASNGDNGIKRHVQEWSRLDRLTGILEHARVEADQWTNHTANTKHKYGKVVDRRARNLADGSKEETQQTKQLEVFQTHTAGCSVQVIRSQTSTTSSWHNSSSEYSPLDVSSQKSKASVGRSGSISARRPPTRRPPQAAQLPRLESVVDCAADGGTSASDEPAPTNLNRSKSCSNDEIRSDGANDTDEPPLDRSSRLRRSLQFAQSRRAAEDSERRNAVGELEDVLKKVLGKNKAYAVNGGGGGGGVDERSLIRPASAPKKKPSFVTVENLMTTKNNLRHLNGSREPRDGNDDGIVTDARPAGGDSRSLDYRGSAKTEEWYNRRKSYGFEKVQQTYESNDAVAATSVVDSSTDSGICRSTENGLSNSSRQSSVDRESIADLVKKYSTKEINNNNNNNNNGVHAHAYNTTVVAKGKILEAINSLRSKSSAYFDVVKPADAVSKESDDRDKEQVYARRLSVGMATAAGEKFDKDDLSKRHSIAVVSEVADKEHGADKKNANKKVEFCRTEVHFDTTPGKINIVDMDDKPAAGQSYRPKKRYGRPAEKSDRGLPVYRFGDDVQQQQQQQQRRRHDDDDDDDDDKVSRTVNGETDRVTAAADDAGTCGGGLVCDVAASADQPKSILKRQQRQGAEDAGGVACDNGIEVRISSTESTPVDCRRASWSVADRVKQVEAVGLSTRVNFTEGETTAVGFDPADPPPTHHRYSYDGTASPPVWCHDDTAGPSSATDTSAKCHEKLLVRIGACKTVAAGGVSADLCAFSKCFSNGGDGTSAAAAERLSSASLVLTNAGKFRPKQPGACLGTMNARTQGRFQKTPSTSWPRYGHKTHPAPAARKYGLPPTKSCADVERRDAAAAHGMPDVIGALDDLSKTIDEQIVRDHDADRHVTLIKVRQASDVQTVHGRLEYVKDLMSTDETSEESLKADEEVRSYMAADCTNDDDDDNSIPPACENLKKLISTVTKNVKQSHCSQDNRRKKIDVKSYESTLVVPNVTSVLLNHEKSLEPAERSQFQPVQGVHTAQVTHVLKHQFEEVLQKQPSKRVPVKIVQDNRKNKPKPEISKTEVPAVTKICATVSLKQVPMTVQPKPVCNEKKKPEKKESIYGNIGYRGNSLRVKDKPATAVANKQAQDLFNTGRDSWLNMPKDLGPKLNKSKATTYKSRSRKETVDSEVSVLEELNKAADEILKAVNGYTDDESLLHPNNGDESKAKPDSSEARLKNKKKAARLLQRANSREALLHLDEVSSSDEEAVDDVQRVKPKMQRKTKAQQQIAANSVATKTTASFAKKVQSRAHNVTRTNVQHKVHPTYYGNVSASCTQQPSAKFRDRPSSDSTTKQVVVDQKDTRGRYQCKITARTFNSKKTKCSVEENKNSIKGC